MRIKWFSVVVWGPSNIYRKNTQAPVDLRDNHKLLRKAKKKVVDRMGDR